MQGQETRQLETWLFALQLSAPDLPSSYPMCPPHKWGGIGTLPPCWPMGIPPPKAGGLFASFPKQEVTMIRLVGNRWRNYPSAAHKSTLPSQLGWPLHRALPCQQSKNPAPQAFLAGTAWPSLHHILQPGRPLEQELVTLCHYLTSLVDTMPVPYKSKTLSVEDAQ